MAPQVAVATVAHDSSGFIHSYAKYKHVRHVEISLETFQECSIDVFDHPCHQVSASWKSFTVPSIVDRVDAMIVGSFEHYCIEYSCISEIQHLPNHCCRSFSLFRSLF
jgi:hypothetical protein